jgi:hypothetical protein
MRAGDHVGAVRRGRARLGMLLAAGVLLCLTIAGTAPPVAAASAIEQTYAVRGTWAVSTMTVSDSAGSYVVHYPTNLGANGFDHPIVTWGNGTNATPSQYTGVLDQLASWGFVAVASTSTATGSGAEVLAGARYVVNQNTTAGSIFQGKLDTAHVGAAGHSQGASGALNAAVSSGGLITSVMTNALPDPIWVSAEHKTDFTRLTASVFLTSGTSDVIISTASGQQGYYNQVIGGAAKARLKGAGHNAIQGTGGGFLGYTTAWFMYRLQGDITARGAFVGSPPEITTNASWQNTAVKGLT